MAASFPLEGEAADARGRPSNLKCHPRDIIVALLQRCRFFMRAAGLATLPFNTLGGHEPPSWPIRRESVCSRTAIDLAELFG